MGLRDIPLKKWYDSDVDDILSDFYIPCLSEAICYRRLAGFFSSTTLAVAAKGICQLIANEGKFELVTSPRFNESDIEAIKKAYESPESLAEIKMLDELSEMTERFIEDHVRAFGWMLANNILTIKVAIVCNTDGLPMDETAIKRMGLFHQKVGILEDTDGNKLSFSGSENESAFGWQDNVEEFKVFRSWITAETDYLVADEQKFQKFWVGYPQKTVVFDLPTAIHKKLIEIAPSDINELNLERWYSKELRRSKVVLRDYQKQAVNNWFLNDMKGIFEMATGTGKTFAALGCLKALSNRKKQLVTIIACPYNHLITQWINTFDNFGISSKYMIADSTNPKWKHILTDNLLDVENGIVNKLIILTTHVTLSNIAFYSIMKKTFSPMLLIVDEVHGIGAPQRRKGLINSYQYRLGLSATPKRWFDLEGTEVLFDYFGDTVYQFPLSKAVGTVLTEYEYYPYFVTLTNLEIDQYERETEKLAKAYYQAKDNKEKEQWYTLLCIKRQKIVKTAVNKYQVLQDILRDNKDFKHCLVYCAPEQLKKVQEMLLTYNIRQHKFTQAEGVNPRTEYGGISERDYLLKQFAKGILQSLVAIKCLDEGVDIPPAKIAIMMSNSGNPREYIQRRGRILRKHPGKTIAKINDIIVTPSPISFSKPLYSELEKKIFQKELKRYKEFCYIARNSIQCLARIERLEEKYGIFG